MDLQPAGVCDSTARALSQGSLLEVLRGPHGILQIEPRFANYKANALPALVP